MAGASGQWMDSFAEYLGPVMNAATGVKNQIAGAIEMYDFPPAVTETYKAGTSAIESYGMDPAYVGAGVAVAATGLLVLACGCSARPKKSKRLPAGKKSRVRINKEKAPAIANGTPHKIGSHGEGRRGGVESDGGTVVGSGSRRLSAVAGGKGGNAAATGGPDKGAGSAKVVKSKKAESKVKQVQGKGKGKAVAEAPPVITEEPEAAKKRLRKKEAKKKAAKEAKAAAAAAAGAATFKKGNGGGGGAGANGSVAAANSGGSRSAGGHTGGDAGAGDPYGGGGEWQTGHNMGSPEGEWETVSHKKTRPKKDRIAAANEANLIPGGLGL